jgi:hypothetical protein
MEIANMTIRKFFCGVPLVILLFVWTASGQTSAPFKISIEQGANQPAPPLQSFAIGASGGKWLLVGGRTRGFHRTSQPEATFPSKYANEYIYVIDYANDFAWKVGLPPKLKPLLRGSNMEYYQDGDVLYLVGGYGSTCNDDKPECYQSFPNLTAIKVPDLIQAITSGKLSDIAQYIVTISDERMRVTGGDLRKIGDYYYLVFGQNYDNIYKGAYTGKYTEQVRRFKIKFDGKTLAISDYQAFTDPAGSGPQSQYHRRDLNVVEAIRGDGAKGISVYGGVFTPNGAAWRNPIYIDQDAAGNTKVTVDTSFQQKMNLYECPKLLMFDPASKTMYTALFGGISYYYYNKQGELEESNLDNWMPFINTITTLARRADGTTMEWPQPPANALPGLMGANAVFVAADGLAGYAGSHEVLDYSRLPAGKVLLGRIYGGILATAAQSSEFNPTYASATIYEVYLERLP